MPLYQLLMLLFCYADETCAPNDEQKTLRKKPYNSQVIDTVSLPFRIDRKKGPYPQRMPHRPKCSDKGRPKVPFHGELRKLLSRDSQRSASEPLLRRPIMMLGRRKKLKIRL